MNTPTAPGSVTLASLSPAILDSLGVPGNGGPLALPPARAVCLLLVDGLGWELLRRYARYAPFLTELAREAEPLAAGFPSTTATSIASIGTGLPPGGHGIVGYTFATDDGRLVNALSWASHADGAHSDLRGRFVPERVQPAPTIWERAERAGVAVSVILPHEHLRSGLSRAVLRGGDSVGVHAFGDAVASAATALHGPPPRLCYCYHADLDLLGHIHGPGSWPWRLQLAHVDRLAAILAEELPAGGMLVVTGDHGMVHVDEQARVDFDTDPELARGVRLLGGEARARFVYTEPGASGDVLATWRERLGDRAWIATRQEAVDAGWFGSAVDDADIRSRIGDLIVAARQDTAVVRSKVEPRLAGLLGHHGSLTPAETLVPLLIHRHG